MKSMRIVLISAIAGFAFPATSLGSTPEDILAKATAVEASTVGPELARHAVGERLEGSGRSRAGETLPEFAFAPLSLTGDEMRPGADAYSRNGQKAEIGASNDGGNATFKFVRTTDDTAITVAKDGDRFTFSGDLKTLSIAVSAPFQKGSDESAVITSAGLPSDFNATIGYSATFWTSAFSFNVRVEYRDVLIAICEDKVANDPKLKGTKCNELNEDDLEQLAGDKFPEKLARASTKPIKTSVWLLGGEASVGYQKFDFFDMATAIGNKTSKTPWSASVYVGWIWGDDAPLLLAKIAYADSFKAGKSGTLCPAPAPLPAVLTCVTGAIGGPKESQGFVGTLELRRELKLNGALNEVGIDSLGIDAKFSYDSKNDVYAFDLPLSFALDSKGNLVGGVDFGWQSDTHQLVAGLFLNSAFSLF